MSNNGVTLNWELGSFKIIESGTTTNSLSVCNCNYSSILYHWVTLSFVNTEV